MNDEVYEYRINVLIPHAAKHADARTSDPQLWDHLFHEEMHRLSAQSGVRFICGYRPGGYKREGSGR